MKKITIGKLKRLNGQEKMGLLRRALDLKSPSSIMIYNTLKENGILDRLRYVDHKNQLTLLSKIDPKKYEQDIKSIYKTLNEFKLNPTRDLNHTLIYCCSQWNDVELAMQLYNEYKSDLGQESLNHLLKLTVGNKLYQEGLALWKSLSDDPTYTPSFFTLGKVIEVYGNIGDLESVVTLYSNATSMTNNVKHLIDLRNSYFAALVKCKAFDILQKRYHLLDIPSLPLTGFIQMYHILFNMCISLQDLSLGESLFEDLKSKSNIIPDWMCFSQMIVLYGQKRDCENAKRLFQEANIDPTSQAYPAILTSLLSIHCKLLQVEEVEALLKTIQKEKLLNTAKTHLKEMYSILNRPEDANQFI